MTTLIEFEKRWKNKSNIIKNQEFNRSQCIDLWEDFFLETEHFVMDENFDENIKQKLIEVENDLSLSIHISNSNFRKNNPSLLSKIFNFKELTLAKLEFKK